MAVSGNSEGPATDASNQPVVDPTQNVLDLVQAAIQRQDDLRESESAHVREIMNLRADMNDKNDNLRLDYVEKIRLAEHDRIDAIRAVDVNAVQQAATVSATQATTLATQVATSAETLRGQVAAAATAATIALAAALEPIIKDIADLRRAQYEAQGQKTQIVDTRAQGVSNGVWVGIAASVFIGFLSIMVAVAAVLLH